MKSPFRLHAHPFGLFIAVCLLGSPVTVAQERPQPPADAAVHFDQKLRDWDGFGVNYVEVCNVRDYNEYKKIPQEYGGLSTLSEEKRRQIVEMIFGPDGLKPGLVKMFLDPFHEGMVETSKGEFDHETTTKWMRYFVREGLTRTRARGGDLQIITTMYGPPAWTTKQKFVRGRDLDPAQKEEVAKYMIHWVQYLRDHEKFPVKYVSLHNEGEGWNRWPVDGSTAGPPSADYNMWWPSSQVVDFLRFMRPMMDRVGLQDVGLTPGETSNWETFGRWYAYFIYADPVAIKNIGLITSHGFGLGRNSTNSLGVDTLHLVRPDLHTWNTSMTFVPSGLARGSDAARGNNTFIEMVRQNIYDAKVNGVIPWSVVQSDPWGGLQNPANPNWGSWVGTGFWVDRKGGYTIEDGYYLYKQVSRAGQPGMAVAEVSSSDPNIGLIAFAGNGTRNPDALVVNNLGPNRDVAIRVAGTDAQNFDAFITIQDIRTNYGPIGTVSLSNGVLKYSVPGRSVITFFAKQ